MKKVSFVLDTNVIIDFLNGRAKPGFDLKDFYEKGEIFISDLTIVEIYAGIPVEKLGKVSNIINRIPNISLTRNLAHKTGELIHQYGRVGIVLPTVDAVIATSTIENNMILASHDKIFAKIKEVKLYKPKV